ncbi:hypothetical protein [Thermoplasma sp.]|uniref:hypothetical protein n=1 Tax=Thermoplasma sp. TaxID=1973142 RepID=UPI0026367F41|nr:hypothetical protein [Thermoplasma sp.]
MKDLIRVEKADHRPFTISCPYGYFISYLDLIPDSMGYHKKGEMNGLWYPPVRLLKNIHVRGPDGISAPSKTVIDSGSAKFFYEGSTLTLGFNRDHDFIIALENHDGSDRDLVIDLLPETIWFSINDTTIDVRKRSVSVHSHMFPESSIIVSTRNDFTLNGNTLIVRTGRHALLRIYSSTVHGKKPFIKINSYADIYRYSKLRSSKEDITRNFCMAKENMIRLSLIVPGIGYGITGGHPDFPWYFGIDTLLSMNGMIDAGFFDLAYGSLNVLARFSRSGRIPHEIITSGKVYNEGDLEETALFPYSVLRYVEWSGNLAGSTHLIETSYLSIRYLLESGYRGRGIMEDANAGQGIDIDTITFALLSLSKLKEFRDKGSETAAEFADDIELDAKIKDLKNMLDSFWLPERNTYANRIADGVPMDMGFWTSIVPFYAGLSDAETYRKFTSEEGGSNGFQGNRV